MAEIMKKHGFRVGETVTGKSGTDMFSHNVKIHGFEGRSRRCILRRKKRACWLSGVDEEKEE